VGFGPLGFASHTCFSNLQALMSRLPDLYAVDMSEVFPTIILCSLYFLSVSHMHAAPFDPRCLSTVMLHEDTKL
jgi:hypothetical protein